MIFNEEYGFLFVAIQKTGTTSIETILKNQNYDVFSSKIYSQIAWEFGSQSIEPKKMNFKHNSAVMLKAYPLLYNRWDNIFKFCFVRNPWDWLVSHYFFQIKNKEVEFTIDFKDWLYNSRPIWQGITQFDCLSQEGKIIVDCIGRFENLQNDFDSICSKIGIPKIELPYHNQTQHKHYREYYDKESIKFVENKYQKDIEIFNYEF